MPKVIDRTIDSVSISPALTLIGIELHLHGQAPQGDRPIFLSIAEARILAFSLLAEAERVSGMQA